MNFLKLLRLSALMSWYVWIDHWLMNTTSMVKIKSTYFVMMLAHNDAPLFPKQMECKKCFLYIKPIRLYLHSCNTHLNVCKPYLGFRVQ
jgi:hypothetical protein